MKRNLANRYLDLSTLIVLGFSALLLVSLPGGCGDTESDEEVGETDAETLAEPTAPPMIEIVDPDPGDFDQAPPAGEGVDDADNDNDQQDAGEDASPDEESGANGRYVVQQGDTLYGIAVQFNVSMEALMALNDMDDPNALQVGQQLQIPD